MSLPLQKFSFGRATCIAILSSVVLATVTSANPIGSPSLSSDQQPFLNFICAVPQVTPFDRPRTPLAHSSKFQLEGNEIQIAPVTLQSSDPLTSKDFQLAFGSDSWTAEQGLQGSTQENMILGVKFIHPFTVDQRKAVIKYASAWTGPKRLSNVTFNFDDQTGKNIRVSFDPKLGNFSQIGNQALEVLPSAVTMNLGDVQSGLGETDTRWVIQHEFGHALGIRHEHLHPDSGISWRENGTGSVVIEAMKIRFGWSAATTMRNVVRPLSRSARCRGSQPFDSKSIMIYPIQASWVESGLEIYKNSSLSEGDEKCIRSLYGLPN